MLSFLIIIPLVGIMLYLALIFESTGFALLAFSAATLAVLSFIFLMFLRKKIRVSLSIPMRVADRDQEISLRTEAYNASRLPVSKIRVTVAYGENQKITRDRMSFTMEDVAHGKRSDVRKLSVGRSGYYEFMVKRIRIYDAFGLFYVTKKCKAAARVMILPRIEEVPVKIGESVKHFYGETVDYDENVPGQDPSEMFGVREFHEGDKLQRIHWKLSARMDDLMVKEDSLPKACAIVLFMPEGSLKESRNLDYVASLSFTLMDAKCAHYVAWLSQSRGDVTRIRVDDEESYYLALTTCLQDSSAQTGEDRLERYREKYKGQQFLHSIVADASGNLIIDGERIIKPEGFREELFLR